MEILKDIVDGKSTIMYKAVKKHGSSGAVYIPKKYIGKTVVIIVRNDEKKDTDN